MTKQGKVGVDGKMHIEMDLGNGKRAKRDSVVLGYLDFSSQTVNKTARSILTIKPTLNSTMSTDTVVDVYFTGGHSDKEDYGVGKHFDLACSGAEITNTAYNTTRVRLTIPAGQTTKAITMTIVNNPRIELDRVISIHAVGPEEQYFGETKTVTIVDNNRTAVKNVVTDLGLDNTGQTNITAALQAVINADGANSKVVYYFPDGTYIVEGLYYFWGTSFIGQSKNGTVIKRPAGSSGSWKVIIRPKVYSNAADSPWFNIANLTLDGDDNATLEEHSVLFFGYADKAYTGRLRITAENMVAQRNPASDGFFFASNAQSKLYKIYNPDWMLRGGIDLTGLYSIHEVIDCEVEYFHQEYDGGAGYQPISNTYIDRLTTQRAIFNTGGNSGYSPDSTLTIKNTLVTVWTHFASHHTNVNNNYNVYNSTFYCYKASDNVGYTRRPGKMYFENCTFYANGANVADGTTVGAVPNIFFRPDSVETNQTVHFHNCKFLADKKGKNITAVGFANAYNIPTAANNWIIVTGDQTEFGPGLDRMFIMNTAGQGAGGLYSFTDAKVYGPMDLLMYLNGDSPNAHIVLMKNVYIDSNITKFAYIYGYNTANNNTLKIDGMQLTKAQNVIDTWSGINGNVYTRTDNVGGVMRTIIGTGTPGTMRGLYRADGGNGQPAYDRYLDTNTGIWYKTVAMNTWAAE